MGLLALASRPPLITGIFEVELPGFLDERFGVAGV